MALRTWRNFRGIETRLAQPDVQVNAASRKLLKNPSFSVPERGSFSRLASVGAKSMRRAL
jgi:hypothetical protein